MDESSLKAVWNMDEATLKRIDSLLTIAEVHFIKWNLEDLYWTLRGIRREVSAKFKKEEIKEINKKMKELEKQRKIFLENKNNSGDFFILCEDFFMYLTLLCKRHGLWFREGDDPKYAVLQR